MWLLCECAPSLRAFMSSIMRWRRGVTASVLMGTPVLGEVETPRSSRQATRAAIDDLSVDYCTRRRAPRSGLSRSDLVLWPITSISQFGLGPLLVEPDMTGPDLPSASATESPRRPWPTAFRGW